MNPHADSEGAALPPFLTYEPFYGLNEKPFSLASDPTFFYNSAAHRAAFDALGAGIRRREGLIVLSGEIGTGKTTLCRTVLAQLDRKTFSTFVPDPFVTREDLLKTLLIGFGVASVADVYGGRLHGASRQDLSYPLYEFLDSLVPLQAFAVLVIDEAQNLSLGVMEEIRILAELERREKLLQVVLVGQPELRENLRLPQMRQVEQRVTVRCELAPLAFADVSEYVTHRLAVAAAQPGGVAFTGGALEAVCLGSGGVPRLINLICDRALQRGFESRLRTIDRDTVLAAVRDLDLGEHRMAPEADTVLGLQRLPFDEPHAGVAGPSHTPAAMFEAEAPASVPAAASVATPQPLADNFATEAFAPEEETHAAMAPPNALSEFDAEPETEAQPPEPASTPVERVPPQRTLFWMLARALGLGTAAVGIAVGAGWLDARAAFDRLLPAAMPVMPAAPDRSAARAATALQIPDTVTAVLADGRAHEPGAYVVLVATLRDRQAAEWLAADLAVAGHRARWTEARSGGGTQQQVLVDGYGTLENALDFVARLRQRAATADARLVAQPGAARPR